MCSPQRCPTYLEARKTGEAVQIDPTPKVADGIAVARPSQLCFSMIDDLADDIVTVDDRQTTEAVALLLERSRLLVEPSGAVTVAALLNTIVAPDGYSAWEGSALHPTRTYCRLRVAAWTEVRDA